MGNARVRRILAGFGVLAIVAVGAGLVSGSVLLADAGTVALLVTLAAWLGTTAMVSATRLAKDRRLRRDGQHGIGHIRRNLARVWLVLAVIVIVICLRLVFFVVE